MNRWRRLPGYSAFIVLAIALTAGCAGSPSESAGREVLDRQISGVATILDFKKVDGRTSEILGVKCYQMAFESRVRVDQDIETLDPLYKQDPEAAFAQLENLKFIMSFSTDMSANPGGFPKKGDEIVIRSVVRFSKSEQGWSGSVGD